MDTGLAQQGPWSPPRTGRRVPHKVAILPRGIAIATSPFPEDPPFPDWTPAHSQETLPDKAVQCGDAGGNASRVLCF